MNLMKRREALRLNIRNRIVIPLIRKKLHNELKDKNFTIISNNCWGGTVYESYNLQKQSPTVGMFIMPKDYIKFLNNLEYYLMQSLEFIEPQESKWKSVLENKSNWGTYLIGKLDDIELHLLHYHDKEKALEKWNKRIKRINREKLLVKFNDQNGCTIKDIQDFLSTPYKNKLCFVANPEMKIDSDNVILIKQKDDITEGIKASREPFRSCKYLNLTKILNQL